ncbi:hypothetical protein SMC26_23950 [Actinomadura fulvescens]|uniref:Uncharacterized protein n=1 Tax=Actinomadura fulvescens TaxID=46160 RepID=A0ABP6CGW6_9ACTN
MSPDEILSVLTEAFPRWTFTREQEVWRANGPVILTGTNLAELLLLLAFADPAATAAHPEIWELIR